MSDFLYVNYLIWIQDLSFFASVKIRLESDMDICKLQTDVLNSKELRGSWMTLKLELCYLVLISHFKILLGITLIAYCL